MPPTLIGHALDGQLLAIDKPAGWRTDGSDRAGVPDLIGWLDEDADTRGARPIHRLDLGASGLVLCARDAGVRAEVSQWLAEGRLEKTYLVLVDGICRKKGVLRRALPDPRRRRKLPATTRYRRLEVVGRHSLLAVRIETGRKHQIRRHLAGIRHPVVGDTRHGRRKQRRGTPERLWLHARALVLPVADASGEPVVFESALPPELLDHLDALRADARGEE